VLAHLSGCLVSPGNAPDVVIIQRIRCIRQAKIWLAVVRTSQSHYFRRFQGDEKVYGSESDAHRQRDTPEGRKERANRTRTGRKAAAASAGQSPAGCKPEPNPCQGNPKAVPSYRQTIPEGSKLLPAKRTETASKPPLDRPQTRPIPSRQRASRQGREGVSGRFGHGFGRPSQAPPPARKGGGIPPKAYIDLKAYSLNCAGQSHGRNGRSYLA
jgi:hypothetical protein